MCLSLRSLNRIRHPHEMDAHPPPECYSIVKTYNILYVAFLAPYKIHYRHESKMFELLQRDKRSQVLSMCTRMQNGESQIAVNCNYFKCFAGHCALDLLLVLRALFPHICNKAGQ